MSGSGHSGLDASGGHDKSLQTGWLETTETCSVTVLEALSPQSSCRSDHVPSEGSRETYFFASSQLPVVRQESLVLLAL